MPNLTPVPIAIALSLLVSVARADDDLLSGLWMESANYPASSILKFEKSDDHLVGRYKQVSMPQQHLGFNVGEVIIRGSMSGDVFKGEVLLKLQSDFKSRCPQIEAGWAPIELTLVAPGKLYGRWQQTYFSRGKLCEVVGRSWQLYGLERLDVQ